MRQAPKPADWPSISPARIRQSLRGNATMRSAVARHHTDHRGGRYRFLRSGDDAGDRSTLWVTTSACSELSHAADAKAPLLDGRRSPQKLARIPGTRDQGALFIGWSSLGIAYGCAPPGLRWDAWCAQHPAAPSGYFRRHFSAGLRRAIRAKLRRCEDSFVIGMRDLFRFGVSRAYIRGVLVPGRLTWCCAARSSINTAARD